MVEELVREQRRNAPDLDIRTAFWLNPVRSQNNLALWKEGVELVVLGNKVVVGPEPDFRRTYFSPSPGWPPLGLILTSPAEIQKYPGDPFVRKLRRLLAARKARVIRLRFQGDAAAVQWAFGMSA
jgi:hypothetical protein